MPYSGGIFDMVQAALQMRSMFEGRGPRARLRKNRSGDADEREDGRRASRSKKIAVCHIATPPAATASSGASLAPSAKRRLSD
jgi:hypothetical protein